VLKSGLFEGVHLLPDQQQRLMADTDFDAVPGTEYFLNVYARLKAPKGLLPAETSLAKEQFKLPIYKEKKEPVRRTVSLNTEKQDGDTSLVISWDAFVVGFNMVDGEMVRLQYNGKEMLKSGPEPSIWREPTDNDFGNGLPARAHIWRNMKEKRQLQSAEMKDLKHGKQVAFSWKYFDIDDRFIGTSDVVYVIDGKGNIEVTHHFNMVTDELPEIPRMGMTLVMPREFDQMEWLGRGPQESYQDRKTSAFVDVWSGLVADQYYAYLRPQENGNKTDVRWVSITNEAGEGLLFEGNQLLEVSAHHNSIEDFEYPVNSDYEKVEHPDAHRHTTDVVPQDFTSVDIDLMQLGVGGDNSWGARTHDKYRLTESEYSYGFVIKPVGKIEV
jgi:beta-galactosidase